MRRIGGFSLPRQTTWLAGLLVLGATFAVFAPAIDYEFVNWDDDRNVYENPGLHPVTPASVADFWRQPFFHLYIPVTYSAWSTVAWMAPPAPPHESRWRLDPSPFHALNVVLHTCNVLVVFVLLTRFAHSVWAAAAGALLFGLHPVQVEPVTWVTGLKDVLGGFWSLLTLLAYDGFTRRARRGDSRRVSQRCLWTLALAAFVLGLLSKPTTAIVVVFVAWMHAHRLGRAGLARALAPFVCVALAAVWLNLAVQPPPHSGIDIWKRPLVALDAGAFYLRQLVLPIELAVDYGRTPERVLASRWVFVTSAVFLAAIATAFRLSRRWPAARVAMILGMISCLPVSGLVPFGFQDFSTVADRYLYLALLGPAWLLAGSLVGVPRRSIAAIVAAGLMLLGLQSARVRTHWRTAFLLFEHTLAVNPTSRVGHFNLAMALSADGRHADAVPHLQELLRTRPNDAEIENALGQNLVALGRNEAGAQHFLRALAIDPSYVPAHKNLADCRTAQRQFAAAIGHYQEALRLEPGNARLHFNLGCVLAEAGQLDAAVQHFDAAVRIDPQMEAARRNLAAARAQLSSPRANGGVSP